jgi:hypothetical protein
MTRVLCVAAIIVYVFCAVEFFVRYLRDLPLNSKRATARGHMDGKMKLMCLGLAFSTLCLFIRYVLCSRRKHNPDRFIFSDRRAVYRTIELSDGWNGRIITTQVYFSEPTHYLLSRLFSSLIEDVLDGTMIVLAIFTMNFAHPGRLLNDAAASENSSVAETKETP